MAAIDPCPTPDLAAALPGSGERPYAELRTSYRFAVDEPAELRVGEQSFQGRLVDASAGGFAMVLADDRQITVGTCGELRAERGRFQVEVVYKTLLDARLRPGNRPRFRIGVKRLKDIEVREPTDRKNRGLRRWLQLSQPTASGTSTMIHLTLIVLLLIVVEALYAVSAANPQNKEKGDAAKSQPAWAWLTAKETGKGVSPEIVKRLQRPLTPQAIFDVLAAPAVIRHLKLSETQQATLRQIAQVTQRALNELGNRSNAKSEEVARQRARLLEAASLQTSLVFSPEQRAQWKPSAE